MTPITEPIPTSLAAIKDHPLYIVPKHVKKYEIIYPSDDASAIGEIKTSKGEVHKVFPRAYLHELHTRDKWLVHGRRVKADAVPVKQTKRSALIMKTMKTGEEYNELFARYQTDPHVVPSATNGIVPKGDHNDVDLRVGLPPNCVHLPYPRIALACRALNVDFAVRFLVLVQTIHRCRVTVFLLFCLLCAALYCTVLCCVLIE
jgi:xeroderma pigmentosum group C-complementing protein